MLQNIANVLQILIAAGVAYFVGFTFALVIWTFRDIQSRSQDLVVQILATLWVAVMNLPGLLIYLILRPSNTLVEAYERSGGQEGNTFLDTGLPVIIVTTRGNKSGKLRKTPLMRVEHEGEYALVASVGGAPKHPVWYFNLKADPDAVVIQDGPEPFDARVREVSGDERAVWWGRAVAAYPPYAEYQERTERLIPVFVATRR